MRKPLRIVGRLLVVLSGLGILGGLQAGDPDCIMDAGVFLQIRLCADEITGAPQSPAWGLLTVCVALMLGGLACLRLSRERPARG